MTRQPQPLLSPDDQEQIRAAFEQQMQGDVTLRLFTQKPSLLLAPGRECAYCAPTQQLLEELAALSPKLNLEVSDFYAQPEQAQQQGITRIPAVVVERPGNETGAARFFGMPMGYELSTLLDDIIAASQPGSPLNDATVEKLAAINQPVHIQVFVTPT